MHVAGHGGGHTPGCTDPSGRTHFPSGCRESLLHKGPVRGDGTSPYPSTTARGDPQTGNYRPQPVISTEQSGPNAHTAAGLAPPPWAPTLTSSPSEHRGALPRPSQSQRRGAGEAPCSAHLASDHGEVRSDLADRRSAMAGSTAMAITRPAPRARNPFLGSWDPSRGASRCPRRVPACAWTPVSAPCRASPGRAPASVSTRRTRSQTKLLGPPRGSSARGPPGAVADRWPLPAQMVSGPRRSAEGPGRRWGFVVRALAFRTRTAPLCP